MNNKILLSQVLRFIEDANDPKVMNTIAICMRKVSRQRSVEKAMTFNRGDYVRFTLKDGVVTIWGIVTEVRLKAVVVRATKVVGYSKRRGAQVGGMWRVAGAIVSASNAEDAGINKK